jgi:hypothetical protein
LCFSLNSILLNSAFTIFYQKRESALTGTSDKSSGAKSTSTPSTPQADNDNHVESRLSHSLAAESSPSADHISEAREDKDIQEDSLLGQETPLVFNELLFYAFCCCFGKKFEVIIFVKCHSL